MNQRPIVFFAMDEFGHFLGLLPVVAGFVEMGVPCIVFTDQRYRDRVESVGARFIDLFADHPLERVDATSMPVPCRYVSFAGHCGESLLRTIEPLQPLAIVYDTFAVIGALLGRALGVPYINVCGGHDINPRAYLHYLANDHRVSVSRTCHQAVEILRTCWGFPDASPFSYVTALSPHLNLYCEPPGFLTPAQQQAFQPIDFFGTLPTEAQQKALDTRQLPSQFPDPEADWKIYVSFGTVVGRYYRPQVLAAWQAIAEAMADDRRFQVVISLCRDALDDRELRSLQKPNVTVKPFVDQWSALREADLFVTHQGLHSTHEAIFHQTPMLSYPFFWDQPILAEKCEALGIARRLTEQPRQPFPASRFQAVVHECLDHRSDLKHSLAQTRSWELETLANRPALLHRILDLCR